jgi:hypothetical protein
MVPVRLGSRYLVSQTRAWLKTKNPNSQRRLVRIILNAELDRLIGDLGTNPLAK